MNNQDKLKQYSDRKIALDYLLHLAIHPDFWKIVKEMAQENEKRLETVRKKIERQNNNSI